MPKYLTFILFIVVSVACAANWNLTELTELNFASTLAQNHIVSVLFYRPNCRSCSEFRQEYGQVVNYLRSRNLTYVMAQLDATLAPTVIANYSVVEYPTLMVFKGGQPIRCDTSRRVGEIAAFLYRKAFVQALPIFAPDDLRRIASPSDLRIMRSILVSDSPEALAEYARLAVVTSTDCEFYHTSPRLFGTVFPGSETNMTHNMLLVFHPITEFAQNFTGPLTSPEMESFLQHTEQRLIFPVSRGIAERVVLRSDPYHILVALYASRGSMWDEFDKFVAAAPPCRRCMFVRSPAVVSPADKSLARALWISESDFPSLVIAQWEDGTLKRWRREKLLNAGDMTGFFRDWLDGRAVRSLRSEAVPESNPGPVYKVVGETFEFEVIQPEKDVVVLFRSDWCSGCDELDVIMRDLALEMRGDESVKFARIDGTKNEVGRGQPRNYPSVRLYPQLNKAAPIDIEYKFEEDFIRQIEKHHKPRRGTKAKERQTVKKEEL